MNSNFQSNFWANLRILGQPHVNFTFDIGGAEWGTRRLNIPIAVLAAVAEGAAKAQRCWGACWWG
jgi:hypothetical protein